MLLFLIYLFIAVDQIIPGLHHTFSEWTEPHLDRMMRLTGSDLLDIHFNHTDGLFWIPKCQFSLNGGKFAFLYFSSSTASNETHPVHRRDILKTV